MEEELGVKFRTLSVRRSHCCGKVLQTSSVFHSPITAILRRIVLIYSHQFVHFDRRDGGFCRPEAEKPLANLGIPEKSMCVLGPCASLWQFRHGRAIFSGIGSAVVHTCGEVSLDGLAAAHDA